MLSKKQEGEFQARCAHWLEGYLRILCRWREVPLSQVYSAGKAAGHTRAQIKAARAWFGADIATGRCGIQNTGGWNR